MAKLGYRTTGEKAIKEIKTLPGNNIEATSSGTTIVTGANTGIGKEATYHIATLGGVVILACRNVSKGEKAIKSIKKRLKDDQAKVYCMELDLSSLVSVKAFVENFRSKTTELGWPPLKNLVLNAGLVAVKGYEETTDGFEKTFGVNHLGHFFLTTQLLPDLRAAKPSRVVVVSSDSHRGPLITKDLASEEEWKERVIQCRNRKFSGIGAYGTSKLCNVLFAQKLYELEKENGITTCSLHPGALIATDIARENRLLYFLHKYVVGWFTKSLNQGASTTVTCSFLPENQLKGQYFRDCNPVSCSRRAQGDRGQAARDLLWKLSDELCQSYL
mmetsp:Transcript_11072/g.12674  ORF Transcript_11072/g.12674 Transcript_11072/m.12674 type:complete len:330 (-) Transcript_11072:591-1580(-)|eukprot:CAMPEP_0184008090 /NCGR_PEP_ID=MMETSP0954-20121128/1746_1 /TAXON_ID=627963 /ORGANISM="Aplanochytrium sp, Strain PBS07" /LENGTH=329 /DNA_ID=CAMNT_0026287093 /DNA_START=81 /DNA_END=1070 /DNA_ORIENTATION=-